MKNKNTRGNAHVLLVIIILLSLIGLLGFLFWNHFISSETSSLFSKPKQANVNDQTPPSIREGFVTIRIVDATSNNEPLKNANIDIEIKDGRVSDAEPSSAFAVTTDDNGIFTIDNSHIIPGAKISAQYKDTIPGPQRINDLTTVSIDSSYVMVFDDFTMLDS